jgi:aspartate/methionine/tyrosine aminotransferase
MRSHSNLRAIATSAAEAVARDRVRSLRGSKIREIANAGMHDPDVLPFWFGEPDLVTPQFIRDAAIESLARGETFYSQNFGIPELRSELARYVTRLRTSRACRSTTTRADGRSTSIGCSTQWRRARER